ncbi:hypothetical protein [Microbacterium xylanilyticum]
MHPRSPRRPEFAITAAVALLHERGMQGVRINANFYATGHWRCRVFVPEPGDAEERNVVLSYSNASRWEPFPEPKVDGIADMLALAVGEYPGHVGRIRSTSPG